MTTDRATFHATDTDTGEGWTFTLYRPGDPAPGQPVESRHTVTIQPDGSRRVWPYYAGSVMSGTGGMWMDMGTGENVPRDVMDEVREWLREVAPWTPTPEQIAVCESLPQPGDLVEHPDNTPGPDGDAHYTDAHGGEYRVERDGWLTPEVIA